MIVFRSLLFHSRVKFVLISGFQKVYPFDEPRVAVVVPEHCCYSILLVPTHYCLSLGPVRSSRLLQTPKSLSVCPFVWMSLHSDLVKNWCQIDTEG